MNKPILQRSDSAASDLTDDSMRPLPDQPPAQEQATEALSLVKQALGTQKQDNIQTKKQNQELLDKVMNKKTTQFQTGETAKRESQKELVSIGDKARDIVKDKLEQRRKFKSSIQAELLQKSFMKSEEYRKEKESKEMLIRKDADKKAEERDKLLEAAYKRRVEEPKSRLKQRLDEHNKVKPQPLIRPKADDEGFESAESSGEELDLDDKPKTAEEKEQDRLEIIKQTQENKRKLEFEEMRKRDAVRKQKEMDDSKKELDRNNALVKDMGADKYVDMVSKTGIGKLRGISKMYGIKGTQKYNSSNKKELEDILKAKLKK